jgi:hypothetical protein
MLMAANTLITFIMRAFPFFLMWIKGMLYGMWASRFLPHADYQLQGEKNNGFYMPPGAAKKERDKKWLVPSEI